MGYNSKPHTLTSYIVTHTVFDCGFQLSYSHCTSYTTTVWVNTLSSDPGW